jgi:adenylosuccinate lyase
MELNTLTAISPIDGRYRRVTKSLADYYSEFALIKYRVEVEVEYFIALCEDGLPQLSTVEETKFEPLREIYRNFSEADAEKIKEIEKVTNHDVKAVEYFIKEKFDVLDLSAVKEFIHFGLTSQDINNTSIPLSLKRGLHEVLEPAIIQVNALIQKCAEDWADVPMLAKTHGQPASPTKLGKEMAVFASRVQEMLIQLGEVPFAAKFGGATGNFNAHTVAYPDKDWHAFGNHFVEEYLELKRSYPTTQIEHYDHMAAHFDALKRISTILIDFARDVWQYVSMNYFKQKIKEGEVGSSAMPHKVTR